MIHNLPIKNRKQRATVAEDNPSKEWSNIQKERCFPKNKCLHAKRDDCQ